jgi:hypothetical protein
MGEWNSINDRKLLAVRHVLSRLAVSEEKDI